MGDDGGGPLWVMDQEQREVVFYERPFEYPNGHGDGGEVLVADVTNNELIDLRGLQLIELWGKGQGALSEYKHKRKFNTKVINKYLKMAALPVTMGFDHLDIPSPLSGVDVIDSFDGRGPKDDPSEITQAQRDALFIALLRKLGGGDRVAKILDQS